MYHHPYNTFIIFLSIIIMSKHLLVKEKKAVEQFYVLYRHMQKSPQNFPCLSVVLFSEQASLKPKNFNTM